MSDFDQELDARGIACPLPILKTRKLIKDMSSGQILKIQATDPGSVKDFSAFCTQTGNELVSSTEADGVYHYLIKVSG